MSTALQSIAGDFSALEAQAPDQLGYFSYHGVWAPGVRLFRRLRFAAKTAIIGIAVMLPLLCLLGYLVYDDARDARQVRRAAMRQHVEVAQGILAWAQGEELAGHMSREQAQRLALSVIGALRYDQSGYFWISDLQPHMVMHPLNPELNGTDLAGVRDPKGYAYYQAMADSARRDGHGYVSYQWSEPGGGAAVERLAYVQRYAPWGWMIASAADSGDLDGALKRRVLGAGAVVVGVLLSAGYLFFCFYRVMDGGLRETRRHLQAMAQGDLTSTPSPWGEDEAAQLMLDLRGLQAALHGVVERVRRSSDQLLHSSGEVAAGSMDLSHRTEKAAANLEQAAASMSQISSTVQTGTAMTEEATRVARHNAELAADGGRVMRQVVDTMDGIHTASARISEITGTIDSIAFQTNILALNAAVEAARAGEQGRGFAVVASEVRVLAQRSAAAARQIKGLIDASATQVEAGAGVVRQAGATIAQIVQASQRVDQLLGDIANGAREQNQGIVQVSGAVDDLERMTQQNAALVEQTAAAAATMREHTQALVAEVDHFRLPAQLA